ncbi:MAG: NAD-dependent epimerase/dehydratase family protein [Alphaproteobacteria bacterium]
MSGTRHQPPFQPPHAENSRGPHYVIGSDGAAFETARAALERGYEAVVMVPRGDVGSRAIPSDIRARDFDDRNIASLTKRFEDAACVHYCAGTTGYPIDSDEPERLARLIEAVARARVRFVYCDAPYAYGVSNRPLSEDLPQRADDPLGKFLAALSQFVLQSCHKGRIEAVVARHGDLVGPHARRSMLGEEFVEHVLRSKPVTIHGRRDVGRSLTYVRDLGRALVLLSEEPEALGQVWHVPTTPQISADKFAATLRAEAGLPAAHNLIHESGGRGLTGMFGVNAPERSLARLHETPFMLISAKFERAFGMHPTPLREFAVDTVLSLTNA